MDNPSMNRFKAMSMDEQVETIEQSAQEALRAREEIREVEATEVQRRGLLLMEQEQRVIDQLQNDLDLLGMTRFTVDSPIEIRVGLSDLEPIQIEEIIGKENPEVPPP